MQIAESWIWTRFVNQFHFVDNCYTLQYIRKLSFNEWMYYVPGPFFAAYRISSIKKKILIFFPPDNELRLKVVENNQKKYKIK